MQSKLPTCWANGTEMLGRRHRNVKARVEAPWPSEALGGAGPSSVCPGIPARVLGGDVQELETDRGMPSMRKPYVPVPLIPVQVLATSPSWGGK
jgi:hypothetical protein